jgi:hypothetical protein
LGKICSKPEYEGQVALSGDPRVSAQAQMSVYAAALATAVRWMMSNLAGLLQETQ